MIVKTGIILLLFVSFKALYNLYYLLIARWYYKKYVEHTKGAKSWFIKEHRQEIIRLFEKAGLEDTNQPNAEPIGYGYISTGSFSVYRNLALLSKDIVIIANGQFREAIGIYKQRIFEAFNPIYWIEIFFYLPKVIFGYLGIVPQKTVVKVFQVLWWVVVAVSVIIGIVFNSEFMSWIEQFI